MTAERIPAETMTGPDTKSIRLANLGRESSIKSIGQLCYLVAFFSVLGTIEFALFAVGILPRDEFQPIASAGLLDLAFWGFSCVFGLNAVGQVVLGFGLIRLRPWARWTVIVLTGLSLALSTMSSLVLCASGSTSGLIGTLTGLRIADRIVGLVNLLIGGLVHLLILWPLVGPGSGVVFSTEYRAVVRQTPEIRSRMHWLLKGLIGLILTAVVGFVAYLFAIYFRIID